MRTLLFLVFVALLSGCVSSPEQPSTSKQGPIVHENVPGEPIDISQPWQETYNFTGSVLVGVGDPNTTGYVTNGTHLFSFPVKHRAVAFVAFLSWQDTLSDLDLFVNSPSCGKGGICLSNTNGAIGQSDSPVRIGYENDTLESGDWSYQVWSKLAANVPFDGNVTVYYR